MQMFIRVTPEGVRLTIDEQAMTIPCFAIPYVLSALADVNLDFHKLATIEIPMETRFH